MLLKLLSIRSGGALYHTLVMLLPFWRAEGHVGLHNVFVTTQVCLLGFLTCTIETVRYKVLKMERLTALHLLEYE